MSNPAFMSVCLVGEIRSFDRLKMTGGLQNRREPLVENGFYYPKRWLGKENAPTQEKRCPGVGANGNV